MDAKSVLDQLLASGKSLWEEGKQVVQRHAGVPEGGESRDAMLSGLGKGAAAGGLLALLLGTRAGRKVTGRLVTYGGLAALGTLAWRTYEDWRNSHPHDPSLPPGTSLTQTIGVESRQRSQRLLRAMIMACRADGHIDDAERRRIDDHVRSLDLDAETQQLILHQLEAPIDLAGLARQVASMAEATEIYLASRAVIDVDVESERDYLKSLADALNLPAQLVQQLNSAGSSS